MQIVNSLWRSATRNSGTQRVAKLRHAEFEMKCDLSKMLQRQFYFFGTYFLEERNLGCWEGLAKDANIVFDVGANAGIYSLAALAVNRQAIVHAFEPTPEICNHLRNTARRNRLEGLFVHEVAVDDTDGFGSLHRYEHDGNDGMNFVRPGPLKDYEERVRTISLDRFCADKEIQTIDLMKIDVQGHEHLVLAGAENLLGGGRIKAIFLELNWSAEKSQNSPADQCIRLLEQAGYQFSKPRAPLSWHKAGPWLRSLEDVVARLRNGD